MWRKIKWTILLILLLILSYIGYVYYQKTQNKVQIENPLSFVEVFSWDLVDSISVVWKTNILNEQKLKFNQWWTVKSVYVQVWQNVKQWDLLAQLDNSEVLNEISDAQIKLENSQIELEKLIDRTNNIDKLKALNMLENLEKKSLDLQIELNDLKKEHQLQIKDKENEISDAERSLINQKTELELNISELETNLILKKKELSDKDKTLKSDNNNLDLEISKINKNLQNKISMYFKDLESFFYTLKDDSSDIEQSLRSINWLLKKDSDFATIEFNYYYSFKNLDYKHMAERYYFETKTNLKKLNDCIKMIEPNNIQIQSLQHCLNIENDLYKAMYQLWDNSCKWLDFSTETEEFSNDIIASFRSICSSIKSNSFSKQSNVLDLLIKLSDMESPSKLEKDSQVQIDSKKQEYENSLTNFDRQSQELIQYEKTIWTKKSQLYLDYDKSNQSLEKLRESLDKLKKDQKISIDNKQHEIKNHSLDLQLALKDFEKLKDNEEEKLAMNNIKQNQINLEQVKKKLENYELRAPFDWVINIVDLKVWDNLVSDNQSSINIVNPNIIEVTIMLDQIDVVKVNKWQSASIMFDAFPWEIFQWKLWDIDTKPKEDYWTSKYQVSVYLEKTQQDQKIYSWMSASVEIILNKQEWVIMVASMSLEMDEATWMNYVTKYDNWNKIKQFVETWMISNWNTQILSWLNVWDKILEINFDSNKFQPQEFNSFGWMWY